MDVKSAQQLIKDLRAGKELRPGPQTGLRQSCEPAAGLTSLTEAPYGPGFKVRPDL